MLTSLAYWPPPRLADGRLMYGYPGTQSISAENPMMRRSHAEAAKTMGNDLRRQGRYTEALQAYCEAIAHDSAYTDAYFNLAQLQDKLGQTPAAASNLVTLLTVNPNDHDARVLLGDLQEKLGQPQEAKRRYMEVLSVQPNFDPAKRRLEYLLFLDQRRYFPDTAQELLKTQYREVIFKARELIRQFYAQMAPNPRLARLAQTLPIVFDTTQAQGDRDNVAEYDQLRGQIRIQPQMLFSTPNIVGAYLVHELVHAADGDSLTSITEEQDAYRALAQFWQRFKNAELDPNLDRALSLYTQNADLLDQEVRRVYSIQSPGIAEKSPGHGLPLSSGLAALR